MGCALPPTRLEDGTKAWVVWRCWKPTRQSSYSSATAHTAGHVVRHCPWPPSASSFCKSVAEPSRRCHSQG